MLGSGEGGMSSERIADGGRCHLIKRLGALLNCHPALPLPPPRRGVAVVAVSLGAAVAGDWQCDGSGRTRRQSTGTRSVSSWNQRC